MAKYIRCSDLLAIVNGMSEQARKEFRESPLPLDAVEAVEVVRCEDCIYWENEYGISNRNFCSRVRDVTHSDFYCADGEKSDLD